MATTEVDPLALKVAFKYVQKEDKKTRINRVSRAISDATGISKSKATAIADSLVRSGRNIEDLARQKGWPVNDQGDIEGPRGTLSFDEARRFLT